MLRKPNIDKINLFREKYEIKESPKIKPFIDPYQIHELLRQNMMMYDKTDPQKIDNSNLDTRLNNELRTIKPSVMNEDEKIT